MRKDAAGTELRAVRAEVEWAVLATKGTSGLLSGALGLSRGEEPAALSLPGGRSLRKEMWFCRFLLNMEVEKLQREQWSLAVGVPGSQARSVGIYSWGWRRSLTRGGG